MELIKMDLNIPQNITSTKVLGEFDGYMSKYFKGSNFNVLI